MGLRSVNNPKSSFEDPYASTGKDAVTPAPVPFSASGGTTHTPGNGYKYHVFDYPNSDTFVVSSGGECDILCVAGGAGGGAGSGGSGGGAGGVAHAESFQLIAGTYPVAVGGGGAANNNNKGSTGGNSYIGSPGSALGNNPDYMLAKGGGGGAYDGGPGAPAPIAVGNPGGSGGGAGASNPTNPDATQPGTNPSPDITDYGNGGGHCPPSGGPPSWPGAYRTGGGGGAGATGSPGGGWSGGGDGGNGQPFPDFKYPLIGKSPLANPAATHVGGSPTFDHFGGGGGSSTSPLHPRAFNPADGFDPGPSNGLGGMGGGGIGSPSQAIPPATFAPGIDGLGGGGGGSRSSTAMAGGNGVVVVRYQL